MRIINSYLMTMVRKFGIIVERDLVEVIELENGKVYEVTGGSTRGFRELNRELFDDALITSEYKIN